MSAIAGIFARTGQPIDDGLARRLSDALGHVGPDGEHLVCGAHACMLYRPFHTDSESRRVAQPIVTASGVMMVWDGRLDNAADIRRWLEPSATERLNTPNLVLAAYARHGLDAFAHLIGDFACAIWEPAHQRLLLCCDALGMRSLSYRLTDDLCVWSTTGRSILEACEIEPAADEEYLAAFLVNQSTTHSAFKGIDIIPGAHALIVTPSNARLSRYWSFNPSTRIDGLSDAEYEAQLRHVFEEAVACRINADAPVFCELSGGVDSAAIACMAEHLRRASPAVVPEIRTASYVFRRSKTSDETPFIQLVEAQLGRPGLHVDETEHELLTPFDPATIRSDFPTNQLCFMARHDRVHAAMHEVGARVILSGLGGDQVFWSQPPEALPLADLAVQRHWGALFRATRDFAHALSWPYWKTFWRGACWPLLPHWWQNRTARDGGGVGEWLRRDFVKRAQLRERVMLIQDDDLGFPLPSSAMQYGLLRQTFRRYVLDLCLTNGSVDMRYPFLDRRVVEFGLAIPLSQKVRPRETRSIVRRGLAGIVPDAIRFRTSKFGPTEAFYRALTRQWSWIATLLADPRVCAYGLTDHRALMTAFQQARHGRVSYPTQLTRTLSVELWLRSLEHEARRGARGVAA
jgi:asparagine synthase (glutamine-hydrolysing)